MDKRRLDVSVASFCLLCSGHGGSRGCSPSSEVTGHSKTGEHTWMSPSENHVAAGSRGRTERAGWALADVTVTGAEAIETMMPPGT